MKTDWTAERLAEFSERVADAFREKKIRAPVHLCSATQAEPLLRIFQDVGPNDWVFSSWRSSYHALLKGIPTEWVFAEVLAGRSMYLMSKEHRFFSSAIVGGILPIACGVAAGVKMLRDEHWMEPAEVPNESVDQVPPKVWVFVGDMTEWTGIYEEFKEYCAGHSLPVSIVVEDNGLSTDTPTREAWGPNSQLLPEMTLNINRYKYARTWPHVGVGTHVAF